VDLGEHERGERIAEGGEDQQPIGGEPRPGLGEAEAGGHPLAEKASVSLADLRDQDFVDGHLPRSLAPLRTPLRFVRLRGRPPRWNVTLVARAHMELSAAGRAFFEMVVGENA
jgi:hypothetical protein